MKPIRILPFGACLMHGPLNPIVKSGGPIAFSRVSHGPIPGVYTFGEIFQVIDLLQKKIEFPPELRPFASLRDTFRPLPEGTNFEDVDIVLVELNTPVEIQFRDYFLNRAAIIQLVTNPIAAANPDARRVCSAWLQKGLMRMNSEIQKSTADDLLKHLPENIPNREIIADVIRESRPHTRKMYDGFKELRRATGGRPMGVILFMFRYLPDGRAVAWPEGFHEEIREAAAEFNLPVYNPADLVSQYGVQTAMRPDLLHYNDDFLPTVADSLINFARDVMSGAPARVAR